MKRLLTNEDGPDIDKGEQSNISQLVKREDEGKDMVWNALRITVKRVECMARVGSWHDPLVMWLVEVLVNEWVMKTPVDQVDEAIGERNKERELEEVVPHWDVCCAGIQ